MFARVVRQLGLPAVLAGATMAGGCGVGSVVADRLGQITPIPAQYVPAPVRTVVLVENYDTPGLNQVDAQRLGQRISEILIKEEVVPVLPSQSVTDLRLKDRAAFRAMTIPQIGAAVGAEQVIYVNIVKFDIESDATDTVHRAHGSLLVRLVNVADGKTLWPTHTADGFPVVSDGQWVRGDVMREDAQIREPVYATLSQNTAALFYAYLPPP